MPSRSSRNKMPCSIHSAELLNQWHQKLKVKQNIFQAKYLLKFLTGLDGGLNK